MQLRSKVGIRGSTLRCKAFLWLGTPCATCYIQRLPYLTLTSLEQGWRVTHQEQIQGKLSICSAWNAGISQLPVDVDKLFVSYCFSLYVLTYSFFTTYFCRLCSHSPPGKFAYGGLCPSCYRHFTLLPEVLLHGFWVTQNPASDWFWSPKKWRGWQATAILIKG